MYSQSCNYLPNKKQSPFPGTIPQHLGLIKNFSSASFPKFADSSAKINVDFETTTIHSNQDPLISKTTNMMDFVYGFKDSSRFKFKKSFSNFPMQRDHPKQKAIISHHNSIHTTPVISTHLIGGFVGSKSQLGRRPSTGFGVKMWDIVRQLVDLAGNSSGMSGKANLHEPFSEDKKCPLLDEYSSKNTSQQCKIRPMCSNNTQIVEENMEKYPKQSYADVTKTKLPIKESISSNNKGKHDDITYHCMNSCSRPVLETISVSTTSSCPNRDRITSECSADSEDSFIVFEYCGGDDISVDDDSSASDDESVLDFHINKDPATDSGNATSRTCSFSQPGRIPLKKVRFAEGRNLEQIHPMVTWDFAYRAARRGPWEEMARDCERFKHHIARIEPLLKPVLDPLHRETVYHQRFSDPPS